jgi:pyruvate/2-oxoglutarate dehydrogenase complex dihydrolipoamide acyltransferase (E2) component
MRKLFTLTAMAAALTLLTFSATAQTAAQKPAPQKTAAHKPTAHKPAALHAPAPAAAPVALSGEQLSIAQIVTTGRITCADGHSVTITPDAKINGAFDLKFGSTQYDVVPVPAKSGAIRLEDRKTGIVFMQLANKSMLFNERAGKRLADDCISADQQVVAEQMKTQPGGGILDGLSR